MNSKIHVINKVAILGLIEEFVRELAAQRHMDVLNVIQERDDNRPIRVKDAFNVVQKRGAPPLGRRKQWGVLLPYRSQRCEVKVLSAGVLTIQSKCL